MIKNKHEVVDYESFLALHKTLAKRASNTKILTNNLHQWLLYVQSFSEFFWLQEYKSLSKEDLIDFGIIEEYKKALKKITIGDIASSLIYCSANLAFIDPKVSIMQDAFDFALLMIYEKNYNDTKVSSSLVYKLRGRGLELGEKIMDLIPCEVIDLRLAGIASSYPSFKKDELKYIKESLTDDLDSSVVIDLKSLYQKYVEIQNEVEVSDV